MNLSLEGRRALVCGSSQGIGLAAAQELASLGATVTLFARNQERLDAARNTLSVASDQDHQILIADFDEPDAVLATIAAIDGDEAAFDILINNSGGPPGGSLVDAQTDDFLAGLRRHLFVSHSLSMNLLPGMKTRQFGRIINVISTSVREPLPGLGVSNTVRGAMASWSKTLASEVASFGITVNNVLPGATETGRLDALFDAKSSTTGMPREHFEQEWRSKIPAGRFGAPREIGAVIAFLATPAASYVNGVNIPVDGGRTRAI